MKLAIVCAVTAFAFFIPAHMGGQPSNFKEKLPSGVSVNGMEGVGAGAFNEKNAVVFYEIHSRPTSQYYDIIRYKIRRLNFIIFQNEPVKYEEGLMFIENSAAKMFSVERKICWKTFLLAGRCKSWWEIKTQEEKKRVAGIIGAILKDNLRHVREKEIINNQDPAH